MKTQTDDKNGKQFSMHIRTARVSNVLERIIGLIW
jgi:hypothetical protein